METIENQNSEFMCKLLSLKLQKEISGGKDARYFILTEDSIVYGIAKISGESKMVIWIDDEQSREEFNEAIIDLLVEDDILST